MIVNKECPGAAIIKGTPELKIKICPSCGSEIELFSPDIKVVCKKCNYVIYNDRQSCVSWCRYARDCVGDEIYEQYSNGRNGKRE